MSIVDFAAYKQYRELIQQEENALPILDLLEHLDNIDKAQVRDIYFGILEGKISLDDFIYWTNKIKYENL